MKKLLCALLAVMTALSLTSCKENNAEEAETKVEKKVEKTLTIPEVTAGLQGTWVLNGKNKVKFEQNNLSIDDVINGTYTVNTEESVIEASMTAVDGNVSIKLPYKFEDGLLKVYNNQGAELVKE